MSKISLFLCNFTKPAEVHKAVNTLQGILNGIKFDKNVNQFEIDEVLNWCNLHRSHANRHPFSEIIPIIDFALEDGVLTEEEIDDILWLCENVKHEESFKQYYNLTTSAIQQMHGILHGIMADNEILEEEVNHLFDWMQNNEFLKGSYPFDEIYSLLVAAKQDGVITPDEINMLKAYFANFIDTSASYNISEVELKQLQEQYTIGGICAVDPDVEIEGKTFSFTGTSRNGTRKEIAKIIQDNGGYFYDRVTKDTDYLIVGNAGNPCWAFSCYGRKVEKAIEMRKNGHHIVILNENDLWDVI